MDALYRISSGEVTNIADSIINTDPTYFAVLTDPTFTNGTMIDRRVFGQAKINDGGTVRNATQQEIDTFSELEHDDDNKAKSVSAVSYFKNHPEFRRIMTAFAAILVDEFNILRAEHGLADRTLAQFKTAIENRISKDD